MGKCDHLSQRLGASYRRSASRQSGVMVICVNLLMLAIHADRNVGDNPTMADMMCDVKLSHKHSKSACVYGTSYGCKDDNDMYVKEGCRGEFNVKGKMIDCSSWNFKPAQCALTPAKRRTKNVKDAVQSSLTPLKVIRSESAAKELTEVEASRKAVRTALKKDGLAVPDSMQTGTLSVLITMCDVHLTRQISKSLCEYGKSYGCKDENDMYVKEGCRGQFHANGKEVTCSSQDFQVKHCTLTPLPGAEEPTKIEVKEKPYTVQDIEQVLTKYTTAQQKIVRLKKGIAELKQDIKGQTGAGRHQKALESDLKHVAPAKKAKLSKPQDQPLVHSVENATDAGITARPWVLIVVLIFAVFCCLAVCVYVLYTRVNLRIGPFQFGASSQVHSQSSHGGAVPSLMQKEAHIERQGLLADYEDEQDWNWNSACGAG